MKKFIIYGIIAAVAVIGIGIGVRFIERNTGVDGDSFDTEISYAEVVPQGRNFDKEVIEAGTIELG